MSHVSDTQTTQAIRPGTAKKLIHAAALAAALVPLGAVVVDGATISCVTSEVSGGSGGCFGDTGIYTGTSGSVEQSNIWKFFTDETLTTFLYAFEIRGIPRDDFELTVRDVVLTQGDLLENGDLVNFPNTICIPTFSEGQCGMFDVFTAVGIPTWEDDADDSEPDGYYATIIWFANTDPLSQPDGRDNFILQAKNASGGTIFTNQLIETLYDPDPGFDPDDPALGGRGDSFSRFGGFTAAPEPSTLLLLGSGVVTALYRRRRRSS
jgi:hypothetical protein